MKVNARGRTIRDVQSRALRVETVADLREIVFTIPAGQAFYRVELIFQDLTGKSLGSFSGYIRAVSTRSNATLLIEPGGVRAGEALHWRVANTGTTWVDIGRAFSIDRREGRRWIPQSFAPTHFSPDAFAMPPGIAHRCEGIELPADLAPGRYRVAKDVWLGGAKRKLSGVFSILG
ncbi:MAG TPA: immunoglobulin-like domain-containing protein [Solirubrobacterales bacterium]|nr:immunoglobulin-like domain-containing protein [Solirubrobacterales bacterium]